jgi:outer membrane protein assembly factor BamB
MGAMENKVYALDGATGQKRWEFQTAHIGSSPALGPDGTLYVGVGDGKVYALNGATGLKRWEFQTGGAVTSSPAVAADGTVCVGSTCRRVYALDGATGQKRWEHPTGGLVSSSPALGADGTVYVGAADWKVYALQGTGGLAESPWPKCRGNAVNDGRVRLAKGPPRILWQSAGGTVVFGTPVVLDVMAWGMPPLSYEWFFNGQPLAGVTGARYELAAFEAKHAGVYRVRVRNAEGVTESEEMAVTLAYTVTVKVTGRGQVSGTNESGIYAAGSQLELMAVAEPGAWFVGWRGDVSTEANPLRLTADRTWQLVAAFRGPGTKLWEFQTGGAVQSSPAIGADGTVYVGSGDSNVYALNGVTGQKLWEFQTGGYVYSSPAIGADERVYVGSHWQICNPYPYLPGCDLVGGICALTGATGQGLWGFVTGSEWASSPAIAPDGTVYVGSEDHKVYALTGATGQELWEAQTGGSVDSSPAIGADGTVYVGSSAKVYALDPATGQELWEFLTRNNVYSSPAIGVDGTVYVGSGDSNVYALTGATGQKLWEFQTGGPVSSSPAIGDDGTIYVGSGDSNVYALNGATGQKLWEFQTGGEVRSSPAIAADGTVYVGSYDNKVYALNGATGQKVWEFTTGADVYSSPAIGADGTVYIGSLDGKLYALEGTSGLAHSTWPKFRANAGNTGLADVSGVDSPPLITGQPRGRTNTLGTMAIFGVRVYGKTPLNFQWRKDAVPLAETDRITGTQSSLLIISNVQATDEGSYSVVVSNALGTVTSQEARLTVFQPLLPLSAVVLAGQPSAGFADGPGATAQFSSISSFDLGPQGWLYVADAGNRRIRVVDEAGAVRTLAGTGEDAQRDGPGPQAAFHNLRALSVDGLGNCYVLDGDQLRLVGADGLVSTLETIAVSGLVVSRSGQVYLLRSETSEPVFSWECGCPEWNTRTWISRGLGAAQQTVASETYYEAGDQWKLSGEGASLVNLARGFGEELLVCRVHSRYSYNADGLGIEYDESTYELLVLGRTPGLSSLGAPTVGPAGMAALTPDWVLMHGNGEFYVLVPGYGSIRAASDRAPQIGLAVDRHGLVYSATANQVLRFIRASTVVLSLRAQDPAASGATLMIVSPPGRQVRVERSRDFRQWEPWQTVTSTGQDSVEVKSESDRLFLRAVLLP